MVIHSKRADNKAKALAQPTPPVAPSPLVNAQLKDRMLPNPAIEPAPARLDTHTAWHAEIAFTMVAFHHAGQDH